jgi:hypothetical protein
VKQTPLPKAKAGAADRITIANADLTSESVALTGVREQARILASEGDNDQVAPPHPIMDRTLAELRKAKPSDFGIVTADGAGLIKCEVTCPSIDRLAVALPRIMWAAPLQGFELIGSEGPAQFRSKTETLGFSITESIRREKHVLTNAERAKEEAWQQKLDRAARRNLGTTYSSIDLAFLSGTTIRPASPHSNLRRSISLEDLRHAAVSAMPRFSDSKIWPVTSLFASQCLQLQRRNSGSGVKQNSAGSRRSTVAANGPRVSSILKIAEAPDPARFSPNSTNWIGSAVLSPCSPRRFRLSRRPVCRRFWRGRESTWRSVRRASWLRRSRIGSGPSACSEMMTIMALRRLDGIRSVEEYKNEE